VICKITARLIQNDRQINRIEQMSSLDQEIMSIIEMKSGQPGLDAGESFLDRVMLRLNQHPPRQRLVSGYIRNHPVVVLLVLLFAINLVSIGLGVRSYLSEKDRRMNLESEEMVYFVDPGQYQVYTHNKE